MGTRADFYLGRGRKAVWLGSIAYDGHPESMPRRLLQAKSGRDFRAAVAAHLKSLDHATDPAQGWPWPWDDSGTTDFAYAFDGGRLWASCFGDRWFDPTTKPAVFPKMGRRRKAAAAGTKRSGVMLFSAKATGEGS